jgi:uncharacterized membrane protein YeiB
MSTEPPGPVASPARIEMLDVARGVAVLGILLMNIWAFGGPQKFFDYPLAIAGRAGAPVATAHEATRKQSLRWQSRVGPARRSPPGP